jgi:uncharacterized protein
MKRKVEHHAPGERTMNTASMPLHGNDNDNRPWYKHRWPWFLMLGPFLVVVAGIITMWLAYTRQDALVVDDYYKQGKAINQDLRRDHTAADMKLSATLRYDPAAGRLSGVIHSKDGMAGGNKMLKLVHSTQPEKDITLSLPSATDGSFDVSLPMLEMARWQVIIEDDNRTWRLTGEWIWPQQRASVLQPVSEPVR